jgi:hypothetical protein
MSECDAERPFARIDRMGLNWLLNGDRLLALTAGSAVIETKGGRDHGAQSGPSFVCRNAAPLRCMLVA